MTEVRAVNRALTSDVKQCINNHEVGGMLGVFSRPQFKSLYEILVYVLLSHEPEGQYIC